MLVNNLRTELIVRKEMRKGNIKLYEEELIENLRKVNYSGIPISIILLSETLCRYNCYITSVLMTLGMENYKIIRCNDIRYKTLDYPNHCVVEHDGWIYDTSDGLKYKKELYYSLYKIKVMEELDEKTCLNDEIYCYIVKNIKKQLNTLEIQYFLKALEFIEKKYRTFNSYKLFEEIELFNEQNKYSYELDDIQITEFITEVFYKEKFGYSLKMEQYS